MFEGVPTEVLRPVSYTHLDVYKRQVIDWYHHRDWWWLCRSTPHLYIVLIECYLLLVICNSDNQ